MLALFALLAAGCASTPRAGRGTLPVPQVDQSPFAPVRFLAGSWAGAHDGGVYEEYWTTDSGGLMTSTSKLVINAKAVFFEYQRIAPRGDELLYIAQPAGRAPTEFTLTASGIRPDGSRFARFENPDHDFPRVITYTRARREGADTLTALLEGIEKGVTTSDLIEMTRVQP